MKFIKSIAEDGYYITHKWNTPMIQVTLIYLGKVCQIHRKTYRIHTTHSDKISGNIHMKLQGHKERDPTEINNPYEYDLD